MIVSNMTQRKSSVSNLPRVKYDTSSLKRRDCVNLDTPNQRLDATAAYVIELSYPRACLVF